MSQCEIPDWVLHTWDAVKDSRYSQVLAYGLGNQLSAGSEEDVDREGCASSVASVCEAST